MGLLWCWGGVFCIGCYIVFKRRGWVDEVFVIIYFCLIFLSFSGEREGCKW